MSHIDDFVKKTLIPGNIDWEEYHDEFGKAPMIIEYAIENPLYVLHSFLAGCGPDETRDWCRDWFYIAITGKSPHYDEASEVFQLLRFYKKLKLVLEAFYLYVEKVHPDPYKPEFEKHLTTMESADPMAVIVAFYKEFPIHYIRRELDDWLFAGVKNEGVFPDSFAEGDVINTYHRIATMLEAGWFLIHPVDVCTANEGRPDVGAILRALKTKEVELESK